MRNYRPFMMMDIGFVLGGQYKRLPDAAWKLYCFLRAKAIADRNEVLTEWRTMRQLANDIGKDVRVVCKSLRILHDIYCTFTQGPLIKVGRHNVITVCGVRTCHSRLRGWKNQRGAIKQKLKCNTERRVIKELRTDKNSIKTGNSKRGRAGKSGSRTSALPGVPLIVRKFVSGHVVAKEPAIEQKRARQDLLAKASVRLTADALPVVAKVCDERMSCAVLNCCIELLCRNAVEFAGAVYDARRGDRPGALMTSFVMRGMKAPTDDALVWAQRVVRRKVESGEWRVGKEDQREAKTG